MRVYFIIMLALLATAGLTAMAEGLTPIEIKSAEKLNTVKCSKCHELYNPKAYSQATWDKWFKKMAKKAKLEPEQADLLARYLNSKRAD